jgi:hypothetical protein
VGARRIFEQSVAFMRRVVVLFSEHFAFRLDVLDHACFGNVAVGDEFFSYLALYRLCIQKNPFKGECVIFSGLSGIYID